MTVADIDLQVAKVLRGLGNPEPPLDLAQVRALLKLDRGYYSTTNDGLLRETISRMKVAGKQLFLRPTLLKDAVTTLNLRALFLPDQRRILLDADLPKLKHRWNEAHEVGHGIIPWHADMMFGDTDHTLTPACHEIVEAEANYAAGRMLFLADRFLEEARAIDGSLDSVMKLAVSFGNTKTSTLWRYVEQADPDRPMVALVSGHPHRYKRKPGFDATQPCRHCIQSPAFAHRFGALSEVELFAHAVSYCGAQRGGLLGEAEIELRDADGAGHIFLFETFFNGHEALTLGRWVRAR